MSFPSGLHIRLHWRGSAQACLWEKAGALPRQCRKGSALAISAAQKRPAQIRAGRFQQYGNVRQARRLTETRTAWGAYHLATQTAANQFLDLPIDYFRSITVLSDMVCRLLSNACVATSFCQRPQAVSTFSICATDCTLSVTPPYRMQTTRQMPKAFDPSQVMLGIRTSSRPGACAQ